jgi:fused signal recognition particle receptor
MFGGLKKKLKEAVSKVAAAIEKKPAEPVSEAKREPIEEKLQAELEKDVSAIKDLEEKIHEEHLPEKIEESVEEEKEILKEEKQAAIERALEKEEERKIKEELPPMLTEEKKGKIAHEIVAAEKKKEELVAETIVKAAPKEEKPAKAPRLGLLKRVTEKVLTESDIEKLLKELEIALLESDVAVEVTERIGEDVKAELLGQAVKRGKVEDLINEALRKAMRDVLSVPSVDIEAKIEEKKEPFLVMLFGFNGVGKTTQCAKLAHRLKKYKPVLAAGDTFRAASIEQLEEHGRRLGVEVIKHKYGSDSAAVIFDAKKHAKAAKSRLVIADTAGRAHSNVNLMDELKKVVRVNQPDLKVLVLDALTGNDIYDQARLFNDAVGVDAIILTKADVYEKGGAALSAAYTLKKPILFLGVGQEYKDLQPFDPEKIIKNILG